MAVKYLWLNKEEDETVLIDVLKTHRDKWYADDEHVEHVEGGSEEGTLVEDQAVRDQLQEQLQCEDAREEHVELTQQLEN